MATPDPRVELVRRVLDAIHVRPTGEELNAAAHTILHLLDDEHVADHRGNLEWVDDPDDDN